MGSLNVDLIEHAEVTSLLTKQDRVSGVVCVDGRQISSDQVLLAGGSWSGDIARQMGFELPVEPVKGQIVLLKAEPGLMRSIVKHDDAYFVPRSDGRVLVGASMEYVGFERGNTVQVINSLMRSMHKIAPGLKNTEIERQWMGFRPGSPDGMPFLGPVDSIPGLWVASGHYRNGVGLAPVTAKIISQWIVGDEPEMDMSAFAVGRQIKNSKSIGYPA